MAKLIMELPYNYSEEDLQKWLKDRGIKHKKGPDNKDRWVRKGDAFKSRNGKMARVLDTPHNEVNEPFVIIANNSLTRLQMQDEYEGLLYVQA